MLLFAAKYRYVASGAVSGTRWVTFDDDGLWEAGKESAQASALCREASPAHCTNPLRYGVPADVKDCGVLI
jgi:hypothetical protein